MKCTLYFYKNIKIWPHWSLFLFLLLTYCFQSKIPSWFCYKAYSDEKKACNKINFWIIRNKPSAQQIWTQRVWLLLQNTRDIRTRCTILFSWQNSKTDRSCFMTVLTSFSQKWGHEMIPSKNIGPWIYSRIRIVRSLSLSAPCKRTTLQWLSRCKTYNKIVFPLKRLYNY